MVNLMQQFIGNNQVFIKLSFTLSCQINEIKDCTISKNTIMHQKIQTNVCSHSSCLISVRMLFNTFGIHFSLPVFSVSDADQLQQASVPWPPPGGPGQQPGTLPLTLRKWSGRSGGSGHQQRWRSGRRFHLAHRQHARTGQHQAATEQLCSRRCQHVAQSHVASSATVPLQRLPAGHQHARPGQPPAPLHGRQQP